MVRKLPCFLKEVKLTLPLSESIHIPFLFNIFASLKKKKSQVSISILDAEYLQDRGFCHNENFELQAAQYNTGITRVPLSRSSFIDSDTELPEKRVVSPWVASLCGALVWILVLLLVCVEPVLVSLFGTVLSHTGTQVFKSDSNGHF